MNEGHEAGHHGHGAVGPLVDEAALLLTAVEDKLQAWQAADGPPAGAPADLPQPCPECGTVPGAACTGCPVCRLIAAVRGERPEVTARMVDGALTIVRALRTLLPDPAAETVAPPTAPTADGTPEPATGPTAPDDTGDVDPADGRPAPGAVPPRDPARRAGAATPPRPGPRTGRAAGLQRIDIS